MFVEARTVLELLHKKGFQAYYIGGKCRNELNNEYHSGSKIEVKDIDIVTNATSEEIQTIFPRSSLRGESFKVAVVNFGGYEFEVATYRRDIYDMEEAAKSKKVTRPTVVAAQNLDEDRARRDYTINAIAQDIDGEFIDYQYTYRNKKISAIQDIKAKLIRAIGNEKQRFVEDPIRILRGFRIKSQMGYEFDKQTLKAIINNKELLEKIPHERIQEEMNKIILGKYAAEVLKQMVEIGIFKLTIMNSILNKPVQFLPGINDLTEEQIDVLTTYNVNRINSDTNILEAWTVLLKSLGVEKARENLESIRPMSSDEIEKVEWLIKYFDLIDAEDLRNALYGARTGIVCRMKLFCMRNLLKIQCNIHLALFGDEYKTKNEHLINVFCSRPYFPEQLKVTGEQMMEIANEGPGPWITSAKEKLLYKLINTSKFPKEMDKYMEYVGEAVEEAVIEQTMKNEGLI